MGPWFVRAMGPQRDNRQPTNPRGGSPLTPGNGENPCKIRRPPPCEGEPGCGSCVQGSGIQILYRSDKMTYADMQIYRYADLLLFLGSLVARQTPSSPSTWTPPVFLGHTQIPFEIPPNITYFPIPSRASQMTPYGCPKPPKWSQYGA